MFLDGYTLHLDEPCGTADRCQGDDAWHLGEPLAEELANDVVVADVAQIDDEVRDVVEAGSGLCQQGSYIFPHPLGLAHDIADVNHFIKKGQYELLMEAKESGEVTRMYTVGDDSIVNSFVMLSHAGTETNFICLDGTIPRDKLEELIADAAKD